VQDLFTANLPTINAMLKTNWTSFKVETVFMKLSGNGVNYKGRGLGNGNFQLKATVELYRPNLPELPTKVISARFGWY
jgi:hypothetical protein